MITPRFLLILVLFLSLTAKAQYVFTNLRTQDGLSANEVMSVYKDSEGFVWAGTTSGLNRFDGSSFKEFSQRKKNFDNVASETINAITEYDNGKIFIGTPLGLSYFDKKTGKFTPVPFFKSDNKPIKDLYVNKLIADPENRLWIFTLKGAFIYKNGSAYPVSSFLNGNKALDTEACNGDACQLDSIHQGIWVSNMAGINFINYRTKEIYTPSYNPNNWLAIHDKYAESLSVDKRGNVWISTIKYPIGYFDFATNTIKTIDTVMLLGKPWKVNEGMHRIFIDSKDRLWCCSWLYRVFVIEPDGDFINLPDQSPLLYKLGYRFFHSAIEDKEGNIWIGTLNGLSKLSTQNPLRNLYTIPFSIDEMTAANINTFKKWGNKEWLFLKDGGLWLFNEQTEQSIPFTYQSEETITRFFVAEKINGEWWFGTRQGIQIYDSVKRTFKPFAHYPNNKPVNRSVTWIYQDSRKNIWYAAWSDGIYRYNPQTGESIHFDGKTNPEYGDIGNHNSLCAIEDHRGIMWFGHGYGIRVFDYATGRFSNPAATASCWSDLDKYVINSFMEDENKDLWLATNGRGVVQLDKDRNCVSFITSDNGLYANNALSVFKDSHGTMWVPTSEGLNFFKPGEKNVSAIDINIQLPFGETWYMVEEDKKLYVTMMDRLAVVDIATAEEKKRTSAPLISKVFVFEKEIPFLQADRSLRLKHNENFFVIEFSSPDHRENTSIQYAYRLKGFDKDWVYCGRRQTATYTNVPNGHYTFEVRSTDGNGQWMETRSTVSIRIQPPFWKTGWFVSLVLLLSAAGIWQLYKLKKNRQREKNTEKTIDYFANSVYGENSVNEICWDIARNCISQLNFEDCVVYLLNEDDTKLVQKAAFGPKNPKGLEIENPMEIEIGKGIVGTVAATAKPLLIADTSKDDRYIIDDEVRLSEVAVPILHDGKVIGVIDSEHSRRNFFNENHVKTLTTIASISSNKIAEAQAEESAREHEIKLLEIRKLLAESQLMALRAQMNPHFVFNCLNSIQECIVTQKYGEASNYLNKFSKLFRMVLNNSGKNLVTLEEEKEVLDLYLQLEEMRFEKSFSYQITIDKELETEEILIPSMLLQPYVENALWHGLMHKDGQRKLDIIFSKVSEDIFRCIIDDNGIGRKRSFELKAEQSKTKRHESKGLKISKDRIEVLQRQGYHATLDIIDKTDQQGNAAGTTIVIELSTFLKA